MSPPVESGVHLTTSARAYLALVITAGLLAVGISVHRLVVVPVDSQWYLLAALTLVSGSATVRLPAIPASFSISETFVFASVLLFGQAAGTLTAVLDGLVISFWMAKRRPEWYRALFNMAAPAVSIWCASGIFFSLADTHRLLNQPNGINGLMGAFALFTVIFFGLNSGLVTLAIGFETGAPRYKTWRENFSWLSLNYFCSASIALLLVVYTGTVDVRFIAVILPLLFVLYLTFKTTMQRVADANAHVNEVNRLYLSTIETIAMAIDAKDQITHGHIRRVQAYALGLARHLGVTDEKLLKAIEAAALLHDTGKLAVPEYILNKPGKLTPAEFEKMKLHVTVGAEILTAVNFPFPVVPIVKCHHENWDGTGYPANISGTDIPIGARILSVVDCYDALTSDRPYRPALSDAAAFEILFQRRGSMYDPLVVDTFARVYKALAPSSPDAELPVQPFEQLISNSSQPPKPAAIPASEQIEESVLPASFELADAAAADVSETEACDKIAQIIHRLIPCELSAIYLYDVERDDLEARHAYGTGASLLRGLRLDLGQRLTGWVAANRKMIANSDATLDLLKLSPQFEPPLRVCISVPLLADDRLIGVLTLYTASAGFSEVDQQRLQSLTPRIAQGLASISPRAQAGLPDSLAAVR